MNLQSFLVHISLQNASRNTILVSSEHWQATIDLVVARSKANLFAFRRGEPWGKGRHACTFKTSCAPNDLITERAPTHAFLNVGSGLLLFVDFQ